LGWLNATRTQHESRNASDGVRRFSLLSFPHGGEKRSSVSPSITTVGCSHWISICGNFDLLFSTSKKNEVETKIWSTFFLRSPRLSVRPPSVCSGPTLQPCCPIRAAAAQPSSNASSPAIRPSSPRDTAARPSALSPLPASPPICFPPLLSRDAAACPPSFLSPLPVPLLVCFFS
jgi:hypothetical protein